MLKQVQHDTILARAVVTVHRNLDEGEGQKEKQKEKERKNSVLLHALRVPPSAKACRAGVVQKSVNHKAQYP